MARAILIEGSIGRGLSGILALLAPKMLVAAVPGIREEDVHEDARYFNRLLGGRELLVAIATVIAARQGRGEREAVAVTFSARSQTRFRLLVSYASAGGRIG